MENNEDQNRAIVAIIGIIIALLIIIIKGGYNCL